MKFIVKNKWLYYLIQFTWGALMNIIGALTFLVLMIFCKKKPKKFGNCWCISIGKNWGGLSLGTFFLTDENEYESTKYHEAGHAIQNLIWGPLFPLVIAIPSAIRYWHRKLKYTKKGLEPKTKYGDIWFEGQATIFGLEYVIQTEE